MRIAAALPLLMLLTAAAAPAGFTLKADEAIPNDGGSYSTPALIVRCENGATSAVVRWDFAVATGRVDGSYSIDGGAAVPVTWTMSPDGSMTMIDAPQTFLSALAGKKTLSIDVAPAGGAATAAFTLGGLDQGLAAVRAACGW